MKATTMTPKQLWPDYFDIVILPPPEVRDHAIALSRALRKYGSKFVLGRRRYLPHVSLYHIPVRAEDFRRFAAVVRSVAASHRGGALKLVEIEMPVMMTDKPAWLRRLHLDLVRATQPFFDRSYGAEELWSVEYMPPALRARARANLRKYGSPMIGEVFRPHITLTSFADKARAAEISPPPFEHMRFQVDAIAICELGPSHSCQRVVRRFRLRA
jgi:hypothetical protein